MSDDGSSSIVLIAMLGNAFSPRWAHARRTHPTPDPLEFCTMNVALRHRGRARWALTERPRSSVDRCAHSLHIGRSAFAWENGTLVARIDESTAPWRRRLRGRVTLTPLAAGGPEIALDAEAGHRWRPHAPLAHVDVRFEEPSVRFRGTGYFDANAGDAPLEDAFDAWSWSRTSSNDEVAIAYDVVPRSGIERGRGLRFDGRGAHELDHKAIVTLPRSSFGLERRVRCEHPTGVRLVETTEDGPFYARSIVMSSLGGKSALGMHEVVSLRRFRMPWVKFLLPFRMRVETS